MRWIGLVAVGMLMRASAAHADVIDFTKLSYGPGDSLVVGAVTIVAKAGSQVSIVNGTGLGIGDDGTFNAVTAYGSTPQNWQDPTLSLIVDGKINSFTLAPFLQVDGPAPIDGVFLGFRYALHVLGGPGFGSCYCEDGVIAPIGPKVYTFRHFTGEDEIDTRPSEIDDLGLLFQPDWFRPYLLAEQFPDVTFTYGFSMTALDYDPTPVPEPSTWLLLALGGAGLIYHRQRLLTA